MAALQAANYFHYTQRFRKQRYWTSLSEAGEYFPAFALSSLSCT